MVTFACDRKSLCDFICQICFYIRKQRLIYFGAVQKGAKNTKNIKRGYKYDRVATVGVMLATILKIFVLLFDVTSSNADTGILPTSSKAHDPHWM